MTQVTGWLLEFYIFGTSTVISGWVPTCDNVHSWWLYSAVLLQNQASSNMTQYHNQSYYPETELTSPCPILFIPSTRLGRVSIIVGSQSPARDPCAQVTYGHSCIGFRWDNFLSTWVIIRSKYIIYKHTQLSVINSLNSVHLSPRSDLVAGDVARRQ